MPFPFPDPAGSVTSNSYVWETLSNYRFARRELIMLVHGQITKSLAATLVERLQRVGQDFARGHVAEHKLPDEQRESYTLLVGMRTWLFAAFRDLKRTPPPSV